MSTRFVHHVRTVAAILVSGLLAAGSARAGEVTAEDFFSSCPGGFTVYDDTTVTGAASVTGNCEVDVKSQYTLVFQDVDLSVSGGFSIINNATITITDSSITTGTDMSIDGRGIMNITGSDLTATGGSINIPPRDSLFIDDSTLIAATTLTLGGSGGVRSVTHSTLSAGGLINIAQGGIGYSGTTSSTTITGSILESPVQIKIGGSAAHTILDSKFISDGPPVTGFGNATIVIAPSGIGQPPSEVRRTSISAPKGTFELGGSGIVTIEDVKVIVGDAGSGSYHDAAADFGPSGAVATRLLVKAKRGAIHMGGGGSWSCEDCILKAGGASSDDKGIFLSPGTNFSLSNSVVKSSKGGITMGPNGDVSITDSKMISKAMSTLGFGIIVGPSGTRTIAGSSLSTKVGQLTITGFGNGSIEDSKLQGKGDGGVYISGGSDMTLLDSKVRSKKGIVRMSNGASVNSARNAIKAGGGFIAESGLGSNNLTSVVESVIKASEVAIRAAGIGGDTSALDNVFRVAGEIEISADDVCTSTGNDPDVPCM